MPSTSVVVIPLGCKVEETETLVRVGVDSSDSVEASKTSAAAERVVKTGW
jgi:hypothetical protein